jgi:hypothetical protein
MPQIQMPRLEIPRPAMLRAETPPAETPAPGETAPAAEAAPQESGPVIASLSDDSESLETPEAIEPPARPWSRAVGGAQQAARRVKDRWTAFTESMPFAR